MARHAIPQPVTPDHLRPFIGQRVRIRRTIGTLEGVLTRVGVPGPAGVLPATLVEDGTSGAIDASSIVEVEVLGAHDLLPRRAA